MQAPSIEYHVWTNIATTAAVTQTIHRKIKQIVKNVTINVQFISYISLNLKHLRIQMKSNVPAFTKIHFRLNSTITVSVRY